MSTQTAEFATTRVWTSTQNESTNASNELTTTTNEFTTKVIELREQTGILFKIHKCSHTFFEII